MPAHGLAGVEDAVGLGQGSTDVVEETAQPTARDLGCVGLPDPEQPLLGTVSFGRGKVTDFEFFQRHAFLAIRFACRNAHVLLRLSSLFNILIITRRDQKTRTAFVAGTAVHDGAYLAQICLEGSKGWSG